MYNQKNSSNKQFIAVLAFFMFLIVTIVGLIIYDGKEKTDENKIEEANVVNEDIPTVQDSKEVTIITSNKRNSNTSVKSNSNSSKSNNTKSNTSKSNTSKSNKKSNNTKSNKNEVPVSYFIAKIQNNKIYVGGKTKLTVEIKPDNATNKTVNYYSSDSNVAHVSSNGIITGISPGVCTITINVPDAGDASVDIQVLKLPQTSNSNIIKSNSNKSNSNRSNSNRSNSNRSNSNSNVPSVVHVTGVTLNVSSLSLRVGTIAKLYENVLPSNASNKNVIWSSSNTSVATVDSNGNVAGRKAGSAYITVTTVDGSKSARTLVNVYAPKNGWVTEGGKRYYYENDKKVKNAFREYVYLDQNGVAQPKIGDFDTTLYGATAWTISYSSSTPYLNLREGPGTGGSTQLSPGTKVTIVGAESNGYIKVKYNNKVGYVVANKIFINLPDVIPGIFYEISNANKSIFTTAGKNIPDITGKKLYKFSKTYNAKIGRSEYYAPLLYPVAKKLQLAYRDANSKGYSFKIYDSYRPRPVEELVTKKYTALYNSDPAVKSKVNYDTNGRFWGLGWFMTTTGTSRHCQAIAIDVALTDKKGNVLPAQTTIHTLDTSSLRKYNNQNANTLSSLLTNRGFGTLESEWWHYEDNTYKGNVYETFYIN